MIFMILLLVKGDSDGNSWDQNGADHKKNFHGLQGFFDILISSGTFYW